MPDLNADDIDGATKMIEGTARSMGVEVTLMARTESATARLTRAWTASRSTRPAEAIRLLKELQPR